MGWTTAPYFVLQWCLAFCVLYMQVLVYQKCWQSVLARCTGFSLSKTEAQHILRIATRSPIAKKKEKVAEQKKLTEPVCILESKVEHPPIRTLMTIQRHLFIYCDREEPFFVLIMSTKALLNDFDLTRPIETDETFKSYMRISLWIGNFI